MAPETEKVIQCMFAMQRIRGNGASAARRSAEA